MLATSAWADAPSADTAPPAAPAATSAPMAMEMPMADASVPKLQKMDENLGKMHALVGQMKDAKDPAARQKLMMEYMTAQHENMMLARDAMGMGMGPGMGMGMMDGSMGGMGMMGKKDREMGGMDSIMGKTGKRGCCMGGMDGGMGMSDKNGCCMGGQHDEALSARIQSLEKRLDLLQEMMKIMISR